MDELEPIKLAPIPVYRQGCVNHCPGCGRTQWLVGRQLAECAFCSTAMILENSNFVVYNSTKPE